MNQMDKGFEKIKLNPKNVTKEELISLAAHFGLLIDKNHGKGGHYALGDSKKTQVYYLPSDDIVKPPYVRHVIDMIEEEKRND